MCPFYRLLFSPTERVRFGDFLPAHARLGQESWLPLTAKSCKTAPGFLAEWGKHGIQDTLLPTLALEMVLEAGLPLVPVQRCGCRGCRERLESVSGFFARSRDQGEALNVATRVVTRSARNRQRGTSFDGALFAFQAIEAEQAFAGEILCPSEAIADLVRAEFPEDTELVFGRFRSSGSGRAVVVAVGEAETEQITVQQRLEAFNDRLRKELRVYQSCLPALRMPPDEERFFALTLMASAALVDGMCLPVVGLSADGLHLELKRRGLQHGQCTLLRSFCHGEVREGWELAHRLPRETTLLTAAGSVVVFKTQDQQVIDLLESLESEGIGIRREEGFGRVQVCHVFHLKEGAW